MLTGPKGYTQREDTAFAPLHQEERRGQNGESAVQSKCAELKSWLRQKEALGGCASDGASGRKT